MKLVVDIPEDYYKAIKEIPVEQSTADMMIICNGTLLTTDAVDRVTIKEYLSSCEVAQTKRGRWITWKEAGNEIPSETRFECSVCHDTAQTLCNGLDLLSPYCPNCGAKMQEVEE